jgi:hypothetical protein
MGEKILISHEIFKQCIVYQVEDFDAKGVLDVIKSSEGIQEGHLIAEWEDWYTFGKKTKFIDARKETNPVTEDLDRIYTDAHMKVKTVIDRCINDYIANYLDSGQRSWPDYVDFSDLKKGVYKKKSYIDSIDFADLESEDVLESMMDLKIVTCDNTGDPIFRNPSNGWSDSSYDLLRHDPLTDREYAIGWHTDRNEGLDEAPGPKSILSVTIYLNDDYEGGEIAFLKDGDDKVIVYKPKAGDIVIFPSSNPFQHAAMPIKSNVPKYFIRHFLTWSYPGSEDWNLNAKKFGLDEWIQMEHERIHLETISGKGRKHVVLPGARNDFDKRSMPEPFYVESQINGEDYYIKEVIFMYGSSLQK